MIRSQTNRCEMYQAIKTRYAGATNVRNPRVIATAGAGRVILGWDDALNINDNHARAAETLANKYGWRGRWYGGGTADGFVFVCVDEGIAPTFTTGVAAALAAAKA